MSQQLISINSFHLYHPIISYFLVLNREKRRPSHLLIAPSHSRTDHMLTFWFQFIVLNQILIAKINGFRQNWTKLCLDLEWFHHAIKTIEHHILFLSWVIITIKAHDNTIFLFKHLCNHEFAGFDRWKWSHSSESLIFERFWRNNTCSAEFNSTLVLCSDCLYLWQWQSDLRVLSVLLCIYEKGSTLFVIQLFFKWCRIFYLKTTRTASETFINSFIIDSDLLFCLVIINIVFFVVFRSIVFIWHQ